MRQEATICWRDNREGRVKSWALLGLLLLNLERREKTPQLSWLEGFLGRKIYQIFFPSRSLAPYFSFKVVDKGGNGIVGRDLTQSQLRWRAKALFLRKALQGYVNVHLWFLYAPRGPQHRGSFGSPRSRQELCSVSRCNRSLFVFTW